MSLREKKNVLPTQTKQKNTEELHEVITIGM